MSVQSLPSTQSALVQEVYAEPLVLKTVPVPDPVHGAAVVNILKVPIISYAKQVYNGSRKYPYITPLIPGSNAIGRIAALGPDSTSLKVGQLVHVDCTVRSRDDPSDIILMGVTQGQTEGSKKLMEGPWRNSTFCQYVLAPLENLFVLDEERLCGELGYTLNDLASLGRYLVAYGGLADIGVRAGETVVVAPATGGFGGGAVMVAVAMGANVIAMGRNEAKLQRIVKQVQGGRVKTVKMTGDMETETETLKKAARGPIDAIFDISPPSASKSSHFKSCISVLKIGGQFSLMGGVGGDVPLPYGMIMHKDLKLKGKWMYDRDGAQSLIKLVEAGLLKIGEPGGLRCLADAPLGDWERVFDAASDGAGWDTIAFLDPQK
ncbi:NAD(P)-binding protein [Polyplosphaeria fusca]|uniref:NAD(P)-binding protein n=1 Tax=Polyplosphaeria fusca TaxID=682080 RepID=A0A9P4QM06_9PLEO|nr:NAD(P)-binding protein [Polyplosphaeria fusca]